MGLVANPWGYPGVVMGVAALALAGVVYFTRPERAQNRWLALVLALEGVTSTTGTGFMFLMSEKTDAFGWQAVTVLSLLALPPVYLLFIGTLDSPFARVLRPRPVQVALVAAAVASPLLWFFGRRVIVADLVPVPFAPWEIVPGPGWMRILLVLGTVYVLGFVAAVLAFRRTRPGTPARAQAKAFVVAFAVHDIVYGAIALGPVLVPVLNPFTGVGQFLFGLGPPIMQAVFLPLLAYGILKTQLFDIDLKLKVAVSRSTLVAVFVAVFFAVAEVVQNVFSDQYGYLAGGLVAALLLLVVHPLQRLADRVSDAAMPNVSPTPDYLAFKKMEVYRAAVESAAVDGVVTERERAVLATLRAKLGISSADAEALERDVRAA